MVVSFGLRVRFCVSLSVLAASVLGGLVVATPAHAIAIAPFFVAPRGSDTTGTGSYVAPFRSITKALTLASTGTTVYAEPGVYAADAGEDFPLLLGKGVSLIGIGPGPARIEGDGSDTVTFIWDPVGPPLGPVTLRGLDISGGGDGGGSAFGNGVRAYGLGTGRGLTIADCRIHDNAASIEGVDLIQGGGGLFVSCDDGGKFRMERCVIERNSSKGPGGGVEVEMVATGSFVATDCVIRLNAANNNGVAHWGTAGGLYARGPGVCTLYRCQVTKNSADQSTGGMILRDLGSGSGVRSTLIAGNTGPMTAGDCAALVQTSTVTFDGCTISGNTGGGTYSLRTLGGTVNMRNCIIYGNTPAAISAPQFGVGCTDDLYTTGSNIIHSDPRFIGASAASPDYHLFRDSPCINVGGTPHPADDLDRVARPISSKPDMGAYEAGSGDATRIAGGTRYETAAKCWDVPWSLTGACTAVLASGEDFPDALAAASLAGAVHGPLLLTGKTTLAPEVVPRLKALRVTGVYIVGGTGAVGSGVESSLRSAGFYTTRIAGATRYDTAAKVADTVLFAQGGTSTGMVFVARGDTFPDALAAAPAAYAGGIPVLLTKTSELPAATRDEIAKYAHDGRAMVLGGTGAVSAAVFQDIDEIPGVFPPVRLEGATRYDTAVRVADYAVTDLELLGWSRPGLATGLGFADALAGGAAAGARGSVLLLSDPSILSAPTKQAITTRKLRIQRFVVHGGTAAVSEAVKEAAVQLLH